MATRTTSRPTPRSQAPARTAAPPPTRDSVQVAAARRTCAPPPPPAPVRSGDRVEADFGISPETRHLERGFAAAYAPEARSEQVKRDPLPAAKALADQAAPFAPPDARPGLPPREVVAHLARLSRELTPGTPAHTQVLDGLRALRVTQETGLPDILTPGQKQKERPRKLAANASPGSLLAALHKDFPEVKPGQPFNLQQWQQLRDIADHPNASDEVKRAVHDLVKDRPLPQDWHQAQGMSWLDGSGPLPWNDDGSIGVAVRNIRDFQRVLEFKVATAEHFPAAPAAQPKEQPAPAPTPQQREEAALQLLRRSRGRDSRNDDNLGYSGRIEWPAGFSRAQLEELSQAVEANPGRFRGYKSRLAELFANPTTALGNSPEQNRANQITYLQSPEFEARLRTVLPGERSAIYKEELDRLRKLAPGSSDPQVRALEQKLQASYELGNRSPLADDKLASLTELPGRLLRTTEKGSPLDRLAKVKDALALAETPEFKDRISDAQRQQLREAHDKMLKGPAGQELQRRLEEERKRLVDEQVSYLRSPEFAKNLEASGRGPEFMQDQLARLASLDPGAAQQFAMACQIEAGRQGSQGLTGEQAQKFDGVLQELLPGQKLAPSTLATVREAMAKAAPLASAAGQVPKAVDYLEAAKHQLEQQIKSAHGPELARLEADLASHRQSLEVLRGLNKGGLAGSLSGAFSLLSLGVNPPAGGLKSWLDSAGQAANAASMAGSYGTLAKAAGLNSWGSKLVNLGERSVVKRLSPLGDGLAAASDVVDGLTSLTRRDYDHGAFKLASGACYGGAAYLGVMALAGGPVGLAAVGLSLAGMGIGYVADKYFKDSDAVSLLKNDVVDAEGRPIPLL